MALSPFFLRRRRPGVSELYSAVLMMGVTLSLGTLVVAAAAGQFGLATDSASLGSSLSQASAGTQLSLTYVAVQPSGSCPTYRGYQEGTALSLALFDYGSEGFAPAGFAVNSTLYTGPYPAVAGGSMGTYPLTLSACAHQSGLTVLAYDASGDVVQFGT